MKGNEEYLHAVALLRNISQRIGDYLASKQMPDGSFPASEFYGKACSAALWASRSKNDENIILALCAIDKESIERKKYHYEFNKFALGKLREFRPDLEIPSIRGFRGTRVANWTLLRVNCRHQDQGLWNRFASAAELLAVRIAFGRKKGIIEDDFNAYTLQYHAFSVALLGEVLQKQCDPPKWLSKWFWNALDGLVHLVLPSGECNYIGRGCFQSFGYSAAILAFAHGYSLSGEQVYLDKLILVLKLLGRNQNADGAIPLIVSNPNEGPPEEFQLLDERYPGWWSYNNYYDYLPFTGFILSLAANVLDKPLTPKRNQRTISNCTGDILMIHSSKYTAALALPRRKWASSMPMPFMEVNKRSPLPTYGGEQTQASLYEIGGLPLPILRTKKGLTYCANGNYKWIDFGVFETRHEGVVHRRKFVFEERLIRVHDSVIWKSSLDLVDIQMPRLMIAESTLINLRERSLILQDISIDFDRPYIIEPLRYFSPCGYLRAYNIQPTFTDAGEASSMFCISVND